METYSKVFELMDKLEEMGFEVPSEGRVRTPLRAGIENIILGKHRYATVRFKFSAKKFIAIAKGGVIVSPDFVSFCKDVYKLVIEYTQLINTPEDIVEPTNKIDKIEFAIKDYGLEVGGLNLKLNSLDDQSIDKIIDNIGYDSTDVFIEENGNLLVASISVVDDEVDVGLMTAYDYFSQFGISNLEDAYENGDISQKWYDILKLQLR